MTIGAIRRAQPEVFADTVAGISQPIINVLAFNILFKEMDLATLAFAKAAGHKRPDLYVVRSETIQELKDAYAAAGIGEGPASRLALIRKIEADAAAQGRAFAKPGKS
jgi:hypothetical protein